VPAPRRRLPADQARLELLAAGAELVHRDPVRASIDRLRITEVTDAVGVTTGAFYHYWDTIAAYRDDLIDHLTATDDLPDSNDLIEQVHAIRDLPFEEAVTLMAEVNWATYLEDTARLRGLIAVWLLDDPRAKRAIRHEYDFHTRTWEQVLDLGLPLFDRELVPPWTSHDLAVALITLLEGYFLRHGADPEATTTAEGRPGYVATVIHLLHTTTRPR
jgi:AcrR family transcriptional regulator